LVDLDNMLGMILRGQTSPELMLLLRGGFCQSRSWDGESQKARYEWTR
jgi:hypothetical protein